MTFDVMTPFTWGAAGQRLTPGQVSDQRSVANALIKSGTSTAPIQHWAQGLDRMASAMTGAYELNRLDANYGTPTSPGWTSSTPNSGGLFGLAGQPLSLDFDWWQS